MPAKRRFCGAIRRKRFPSFAELLPELTRKRRQLA
jgi:hypothetical protein